MCTEKKKNGKKYERNLKFENIENAWKQTCTGTNKFVL